MTKSELINALASKSSLLPLKDIDQSVKILIEHMAQSLANGDLNVIGVHNLCQ